MNLSNVPEHTKAGLLAMNSDKVLAQLGSVAPILERYENGENIEQIAQSLGISPQAVYKWLVKNGEDGWKEQVGARAHWQLDKAEERLDKARDGVEVSQARELLKAQQWRLERVLRRIYGDAPSINIQVNIGDIGQRIQDLERELLNAAPLQSKSTNCDSDQSS